MGQIRRGEVHDLKKGNDTWVFLDVGFSRDGRTCGLLVDDGEPVALQFFQLKGELVRVCLQARESVRLVIEAPLSAAFTAAGNPAGRSFERNDKSHRYWYAGMGCQVTTSAAYLLRELFNCGLRRDVFLYEAFVSFKEKSQPSSHKDDVVAMRAVVWRNWREPGEVIADKELLGSGAARVVSAFDVFGFDFGVPPVIIANPEVRKGT